MSSVLGMADIIADDRGIVLVGGGCCVAAIYSGDGDGDRKISASAEPVVQARGHDGGLAPERISPLLWPGFRAQTERLAGGSPQIEDLC